MSRKAKQPKDYSDIDEAVEKMLTESARLSSDNKLKGRLTVALAVLLVAILTLAFWPF